MEKPCVTREPKLLSDDMSRYLVAHQLALAVDGLLISMLVWCWSAHRYEGPVADRMRLLLLTLLTAGLPASGYLKILGDDYVLFWVWVVLNPTSVWWPGVVLAYFAWWISYSFIFHFAKWLRSSE